MRTRLLIAGLILLLGVSPAARAEEPQPKEVELTWGVKIPLQDGVELNATMYRPKGQVEPLPVVFTLTPYISDSYHNRGYYFAQNGYVFVLVDARGRGNSGGLFEPFANEGRDGYDVVEWLARQPWSNGKVTMWGGSYAGYDQWATLKEFPPHLATIVPVAAAHAAVDFPFVNNVFYPYEMQWLTLTSGVTPNSNLFGESSFWISKFRELYAAHRPFRELDQVVGNPSAIFQKWIQHPTPDAYWEAMGPTRADYERIRLPILSITGHYDGDQRGALYYYRRHMEYGTPEAKAQHYLVIGPWDHAGTRTPKREVGGLRFGEASQLDMNKLHKEWYDWTLKGGPKPDFFKKRVAYYVVGPGAEEWKYADSLETIANETRRLYLHSNGRAADAFHSGTLESREPGEESTDDYTYDPLDTRYGLELEREEVEKNITDQRGALNLFGGGVVYHSERFPEATEITGQVRLVVWMSLDVPDTDFAAALYEIQPDGTSIALTDDIQRARYRQGLRAERLVPPGEVLRYEFKTFQFFSRRVQKGSRLRLVLESPNTIYLQKNYNSGKNVSEETAQDARTAHVTIYHDAAHASYLELPIVK